MAKKICQSCFEFFSRFSSSLNLIAVNYLLSLTSLSLCQRIVWKQQVEEVATFIVKHLYLFSSSGTNCVFKVKKRKHLIVSVNLGVRLSVSERKPYWDSVQIWNRDCIHIVFQQVYQKKRFSAEVTWYIQYWLVVCIIHENGNVSGACKYDMIKVQENQWWRTKHQFCWRMPWHQLV